MIEGHEKEAVWEGLCRRRGCSELVGGLVGWLVGRCSCRGFVVGVVADLARYESRSRRNNNDDDDDDGGGAYDNSDGVVATNTDR